MTEAVVTVPAWFGMRPKQMTEKAAHLAGFTKVQLLHEPVAAAMVYSAKDPRKNLRIMTYDLGGGTFDAAILDKIDGAISNESVRDFDGDRHLGGYNFDELLVHWLLEQLNERGYDLQLDRGNPADNVIFAKLMILVERAKKELSDYESYTFGSEKDGPLETGFEDHSGNPVMIDNLTISREDFEAMIASLIDYSISLCRRAIAKVAEKEKKEKAIDQIVLVGGSSRIPLVAKRIEEAFGLKPQLFLPDLAVALGASIVAAAAAGTVDGCLELDRIPTETDLPSLVVTGHIVPAAGLPEVAGCAVTLKATDSSYDGKRDIREDGKFSFSNITLALEARTDFVLQVATPAGTIAKTHRFSVKQTVETRPPPQSDPVLAKSITIQCREGFREIAPAGVRLPFDRTVDQATTDTSGVIRIPLWEQEHVLGEIVLKGIDPDLPVGSTVQVSLTINENFQIRGRAHVPQLSKEVTLDVVIPPPDIKTFEDLRKRYETLSALADAVIGGLPPGVVFGNSDVDMLKAQLKRCEEILCDPAGQHKCSELQDKLDEIAAAIRKIQEVKLKPSREEWEATHKKAEKLLKQAIGRDEKTEDAGYDKQQAAIRIEGDKAYADRNRPAWKVANKNLDDLCATLQSIVNEDDGGGIPPDPIDVLNNYADRLEKVPERLDALPKPYGEIAKRLKARDVPLSEDEVIERLKVFVGNKEDQQKVQGFRNECKTLGDELKAIKPNSPNWQGEAWGWRSKLDDLNERISQLVEHVVSGGLTKEKS